jgi:tetratricopeptide (TPR) repeat protein
MIKLKLLLCLCFLLVNISIPKAAENYNEKLFKSGSIFLLNGNYIKAINKFELLRSAGTNTPELYCNLGNAYYKAGFPGKAIFYYEEGLLQSPLDRELIHNKNTVNSQLNLPGLDNSASLLISHPRLLIIADDGIVLSIFLFVVSCLSLVALSFEAFKKWKSILKTTYKYCLTIAILFFVVLSGLFIREKSISYAIARMTHTEVKTGPGSMAKNIFILNEGEKVEIKNYYNGWYKIKRYNGAEGWANSSKIDLIK